MNMDSKPDISNYSLADIKQAMDSIDKEKYPDRYLQLKERLLALEKTQTPTKAVIYSDSTTSNSSLFLGRFVYLGGCLLLFYFIYLALQTGQVSGYRGNNIYLEESPVFFYLRIAIYAILGTICGWASFHYWYKKVRA